MIRFREDSRMYCKSKVKKVSFMKSRTKKNGTQMSRGIYNMENPSEVMGSYHAIFLYKMLNE